MNITAIVAAIAMSVGIAIGYQLQNGRVNAAKLELKNEQLNRANERISQQRAARAAIERATSQVVTAQNQAVERAAALRAAADAARAESDGLRNSIAIAMRAAHTNLDACIVTADAIGGLLDQCGREYQELGAKADRHVSDIKLIRDAWPR